MSITVEFKDFNEMLDFAKVLLSKYSKPDEAEDKKPAISKAANVPEELKEEVPFEGGTVMTYTLEEVRAKLAELTRSGKAKEVKELLNSFGAKNLTSLDPKHYAAVMEKAGAL